MKKTDGYQLNQVINVKSRDKLTSYVSMVHWKGQGDKETKTKKHVK